ncbi:MAG: CpaF family protein, partial [Rhodospirillales bacterium]|nr:CpaF family protein [Rhodospirillales bacterium]
MPEGRLADAPASPAALPNDGGASLAELRQRIEPAVFAALEPGAIAGMPRVAIARRIGEIVADHLAAAQLALEPLSQRDLVTALINATFARGRETPAPARTEEASAPIGRSRLEETRVQVQPLLMERMDIAVASKLPRKELAGQIADIVGEILAERRIQLNLAEQRDLVTILLDDMLGLGPLESLLADETVTDIMVNGAHKVYVERRGKL